MKIKLLTGQPEMVVAQMMASSAGHIWDVKTPHDPLVWWKNRMWEEHSILRSVTFMIMDDKIRGDVCNQLVRHTKGLPTYSVQSGRPDLGAPVRKPSNEEFKQVTMVFNPIGWMALCRERLCKKAMKETTEWVFHVVQLMSINELPFFQALSWASVPLCIYRGGCPMSKSCRFYDDVFNPVSLWTMKQRYDHYNDERG